MAPPTSHVLRGLATTLILAACADGVPEAARPVVDTVSPGVVRVTSPGPVWADSATAWRLVETLRIQGQETTPSELISPMKLAVDEWGRVYVADQKPTVIKLYDRDGTFIRTIGREGAGPGEFRVALLAVGRGEVVVHDPPTARTSVFDTTGAYLRSWSSGCCFWTDIQLDQAGLVYVPTLPQTGGGERSREAFVRYQVLDGGLVDTVWVPRREEARMWVLRQGNDGVATTPVPLTPQVVYGLDPRGGLVYGWSGEYQLVRSTNGRDTTGLVARAWSPEPVSASWKRAIVDTMVENWNWAPPAQVRAAFRVEDIPDTRPAFETIGADPEGRIWVRLGYAQASDTGVRFDVFESDGRWLGTLTVPLRFERFPPPVFTGDALVLLALDDLGRPMVVRYTRIAQALADRYHPLGAQKWPRPGAR